MTTRHDWVQMTEEYFVYADGSKRRIIEHLRGPNYSSKPGFRYWCGCLKETQRIERAYRGWVEKTQRYSDRWHEAYKACQEKRLCFFKCDKHISCYSALVWPDDRGCSTVTCAFRAPSWSEEMIPHWDLWGSDAGLAPVHLDLGTEYKLWNERYMSSAAVLRNLNALLGMSFEQTLPPATSNDVRMEVRLNGRVYVFDTDPSFACHAPRWKAVAWPDKPVIHHTYEAV